MLLLWLITGARAATLVVGPGGYASVQEAVDAASAGDTVEITAGTWAESVVIDRDLALVGVDGAASTWLSSEDTALVLAGSEVAVSGLTVAGATRGVEIQGGGLSLSDSAVTGVRHGGDGGGVRVEGGTLALDAVVFQDNRVDANRGGHLFALDSEVSVVGCTFADGRGREGGALYVEGGSLTVEDSVFTGHTVRADDEAGVSAGGAVRVVETTATLSGCRFEDNSASEGTGGHLASLNADVTLTECSLTGGEATGFDGGALTADGGSLSVTGCEVSGNAAIYAEDGTTAHGGGIRIAGRATWSLVDSSFTANVGEGWGGALSVDSGGGEIVGCTFEANYAYYGAGAYLRAPEDASVRDSVFTDNEARYGAGLRWIPSNTSTELEIRGCTFSNNLVTGYGGVLYARSGGDLVYVDNTATGHSADVGGALMLWTLQSAEIRGSTFCYNRARTEDYSDGGAVNLYYVDEAVLENNAFVENRADEWGGAISAQNGDSLRVANNTFLGNTSRSEGQGGGVGIRNTDASTLVNNVYAWTLGGGAVSADDTETVAVTWSDWWENLESDLGWSLEPVELGDDHLFVDPDVVSWSADRDCAEDVLWLSWRSALRDAGDPELLDPDGTRSDMGAFGGPGADPALYEDGDADGHIRVYDCDDANPDAWPEATEIPYDGIDQDCDGADLTDVDGDFHDAEVAGGDDCDDADPTVHPGVEDRWYDGVDSDCDGADDYDLDGDGHPHDAYGGDDCDDGDPATHPGATDTPLDGIDQDCDGEDALPDTGDGDPDGGCGGCASPGGAAPIWLALVPLLLATRREPPRKGSVHVGVRIIIPVTEFGLLAALAAGVGAWVLEGVAGPGGVPGGVVLAGDTADPYEDLPWTDGFDFPIGPPDAVDYYDAQPFTRNHHLGEDWNGVGGGDTDLGDPIVAMAAGRVEVAEDVGGGWCGVVRVVHKLPDATMVESLYAHVEEITVEPGEIVRRGQLLGTMGNCGGLYAAHLHLELRDAVGMSLGGGYAVETEGWIAPTPFIEAHRPSVR